MRPIARSVLVAATAALALFAHIPAASSGSDSKLTLVAYSTPREAYARLIRAFGATSTGKGVGFEESYGASGEQARAVMAGLPADVVALSLEPDMTALVSAKLVPRGWKRDRFGGMVTRSVVVFVVRDGNPKKIRDWSDLVRRGVEVVTPNPATSGGAKWNVMAAYGAQLRQGKSHAQAVRYLERLFSNVVSQDKSAREALQTFLAGRGDVLLAYENEAIFARKKGQDVHFLVPKATIRIENPIAVTSTSKNAAAARAFVRYLRTAPAQTVFAENGFRPVLPAVASKFRFPARPQLFTIKWLGGWGKVDRRFFDPRTGIVTRIQREAGR